MLEQEGQLTPEQIAAIRFSNQIGQEISADHPEVADMYRSGKMLGELTILFFESGEYQVSSERVMMNAIWVAISKLIPKEETGEIARRNRIKLAEAMQASKSQEQIIENARKAGIVSYREGAGIHSLTTEELKEYGKIGGNSSALSKGFDLWTAEELGELERLSSDPEFHYTYHNRYVRNMEKIISRLEELSGVKRSQSSIRKRLWMIRSGKNR